VGFIMTRTITEEAPRAEAPSDHATLQADAVRQSDNPAMARLAAALQYRDAQSGIQSYSRTYHRHSRSHTRK
jgi:hypothetical protein